MTGSSEDFGHGLAAARAALGCGDRAAAEQSLRKAIGIGERVAGDPSEFAFALNELAALRRDMDEPREAEALFRRALTVLDGMPEPDESLLLTTLTGLGGVLAARGDSAQAEGPLTRALTIGERKLGSDHEDLGGLLNALSRLFLKRSAYGAAEPLLLRLYELKRRGKGEDHPEAATVLASLASVREALGRHDEAETMWRRVLAVRERTLAPNHFATATALEHLAESCAARGKLGEALQLFKRATTMRELTLGPSHPSLRIARDRIADLQLQASDEASDGFPTPPARTEAMPRVAYPPPRSEMREVAHPPRGDAAEVQTRPPQAFVLPASGVLVLQEQDNASAPQAVVLPYQERLAAIQAELVAAGAVEEDAGVLRRDRAQALLAAAAMLIQRRRAPAILTAAAAAVLLLGAIATRSRAATGAGTRQETGAAVREPGAIAAPELPRTATSGLAFAPTASTPTPAPAATQRASLPPSVPVHGLVAREQHMNGDVVATRSQTAVLVAPAVPRQLMNSLDSFARSVKAPPVSASESFKVQLAADAPKPKVDPGFADGPTGLVRAQLIGAPPQPKFPEILRDRKIEGEVVVRFIVDAHGRPDASSLTVLRTPHDLMSDAVRRVIAGMRFEPAHRASYGAPAEPDEVQIAFQFTKGTR